VLHFSVTDAIGHEVTSALTATLGVGSLRNTRRRGHSLIDQADAANTALAAHPVVRGGYMTAVLGRLDLRTGVCALLNAGHLPPLLVRDGSVQPVELPRNFPLGMFPDPGGYRAGELALRRGRPTLADDATLLIVDWYGDHPQLRRTGAGADPGRASPPLPG
jgi:serine phosphatase RsbU (regulator of sigma subunit)